MQTKLVNSQYIEINNIVKSSNLKLTDYQKQGHHTNDDIKYQPKTSLTRLENMYKEANR